MHNKKIYAMAGDVFDMNFNFIHTVGHGGQIRFQIRTL